MLKLTAPFKWRLALAVLLGFATIGSSVGLMATSAYIIAMAALRPSIAVLQIAIVGVRFFGLSRGVFRYLERLVSHQITFRLLAHLRAWFYQAVEPLAPARLTTRHSGDLLARIVADIESLEHFYGRVLAPPVTAGLVLVLMGLLLGRFDGRLTAATLLLMLAVGVGLPMLTHRLSRGLGEQIITERAALNAAQLDSLQGAADLLIAGQADRQQAKIQQMSQTLAQLQAKEARLNGLHSALAGLLVNSSTLVMLLLAIPLVRAGRLDGVYLALLVLAGLAGFEAVLPLPEAWQHLNGSLAAARRLFELVDTPPAVSGPAPGANCPAPENYHLKIQALTFHYNKTEPAVLRDISLSLPPGKKVAVIGPSGAGKSTLGQVLLRFWDYQQGDIWLGEHHLRDYPPNEVRRLIGLMSQRPHLFNGTLRENLRLARPNTTETELHEAIRLAQLDSFVDTLPEGLDTWIGELGLRLSGGERQRLALARTLLQNAPILILDEPTANLDPEAARALMQTIHTSLSGRTILLMTHRQAGLEQMDEILVLQAGRLAERGSPAELWQAGGLYRQFWQNNEAEGAFEE